MLGDAFEMTAVCSRQFWHPATDKAQSHVVSEDTCERWESARFAQVRQIYVNLKQGLFKTDVLKICSGDEKRTAAVTDEKSISFLHINRVTNETLTSSNIRPCVGATSDHQSS